MTKLIITRGLPASGKTTWAKQIANGITTVRVNRDDLRDMGNDYQFVGGRAGTEPTIRRQRNKLISDALLAGQNVICDDTNLEEKTVRELHVLALTHGAEFVEHDMCDVPLDECIHRDKVRIERGERGVGETVIRSMAQRAKLPSEGGVAPTWRPDTNIEKIIPYVVNSAAPSAVIVDIDGTVALHAARSPYDYSRVSTDVPNRPVITVVSALAASGHQIIFLSGRPDSCETETLLWLHEHVPLGDHCGYVLYMRSAGDTRNDAIIKYELFKKNVEPYFHVQGVFDDRDRVVRLWRTLGLATFQVADGSF